MNYILAVSGGVDSVVLLDMFAKKYPAKQLTIAHFEHGIRGKDSEADARFVEKLSQKYGINFELGRGNLTSNASEDVARRARYRFLREVAKHYSAQIVTAHHHDDVIETLAINIVRGTGWRGLAVMDSLDISRPLIGFRKTQIYQYALKNQLEYVEDETNRDRRYLRNKLRSSTRRLSHEDNERLINLRAKQLILKREIDEEVKRFDDIRDRYFFIMIPEMCALELLRRLTDSRLTRPQLIYLLLAIKTVRPATELTAGAHIRVHFDRRKFSLS